MTESKFRFSKPRLMSVKFEVNDILNKEKNNLEKRAVRFKNTMDVSIVQKDIEKRIAIVELSFSPECIEEDPPFELHVVMRGNFSWDSAYDNDTVNSLLKINAPSLLLSYMRPIVANITLNGMGNAYDIPFMDFTE